MTISSLRTRFFLMFLGALLVLSARAQAATIVDSLAFSPNGRLLAVGIHKTQKQQVVSQELRLYDVTNGRLRWSATSKNPSPTQVTFSPDGAQIIAVAQPRPNAGGRIVVWEVATRRPVLELPLERDEQVSALALSPDGNTLILGTTVEKGQDRVGAVKHFDISSGQLRQTILSLEATPRFLTYSSDGATLVGVLTLTDKLADKGTEVIFWNSTDFSVKQRISLGDVATHHIAFTSDLKKAALTSHKIQVTEMALVLWDLETQAFTRTPLPVSGRERITSLQFTPDGQQLVVVGNQLTEKRLRSWCLDTTSGSIVREFNLGNLTRNPLTSHSPAALLPDGQALAIAFESNSIELRSLKDGVMIYLFG